MRYFYITTENLIIRYKISIYLIKDYYNVTIVVVVLKITHIICISCILVV